MQSDVKMKKNQKVNVKVGEKNLQLSSKKINFEIITTKFDNDYIILFFLFFFY